MKSVNKSSTARQQQALTCLLIDSNIANNTICQQPNHVTNWNDNELFRQKKKPASDFKLRRLFTIEASNRKFSVKSNQATKVQDNSTAIKSNNNIRKLLKIQMTNRNLSFISQRKQTYNSQSKPTYRKDIKINNFLQVKQKLTLLANKVQRKTAFDFNDSQIPENSSRPFSYSRFLKQKKSKKRRPYLISSTLTPLNL